MRSNNQHDFTSPSSSSNHPIEDDVIIEDVPTDPLQQEPSDAPQPSTAHSIPNNTTKSNEEDEKNELFECNICFDTAQDPVITLCGHLFWFVCIVFFSTKL